MNKAEQIYASHAWNCLTKDYRADPELVQPEGAQVAFDHLLGSGVSWAKLLYPDQGRAEAELARAHGLRVMVRAPGEGTVHVSDVRHMLAEFAHIAEVIEVGNEPPSDDLWRHCWYLEAVIKELGTEAHRAGIQLCTPGWTGQAEPPPRPAAGTDWRDIGLATDVRLAARIYEVYSLYDQTGVHAYGEHVLDGHAARISRWHDSFKRTIMVTEAGIAARDLVAVPPDPTNYQASNFIKAIRYADFVRECSRLGGAAPYVGMVAFFIMGGPYHSEFGAFDRAGTYDRNGHRSFYLPPHNWADIAASLRG